MTPLISTTPLLGRSKTGALMVPALAKTCNDFNQASGSLQPQLLPRGQEANGLLQPPCLCFMQPRGVDPGDVISAVGRRQGLEKAASGAVFIECRLDIIWNCRNGGLGRISASSGDASIRWASICLQPGAVHSDFDLPWTTCCQPSAA